MGSDKWEFGEDKDGNPFVRVNHNLVDDLVKDLTARKESLWKRFCQDVCEKMVSYYYEDSIDVIHFHKVFGEKFNDTIKEWKDGK